MKQIPDFYNAALLYDYLQNHNLLLAQQSEHLSILTDALYIKEPSLCINLLFPALSGLCFIIFFVIEYIHGWCYLCPINLLHLLLFFLHGTVRWRSRFPPLDQGHGEQEHRPTAARCKFPSACRWMGRSLLFFHVSHWFWGKLQYIATARACQSLRFEKCDWYQAKRKRANYFARRRGIALKERVLGQHLQGLGKKNIPVLVKMK